ncbi:protein NRT1/ PTR FAMILY 4.5-like [Aristolochia californica]|uniref:protein NRT1/ PTR FAMILY 4.5-like n=1 Tax=Aristolochia californica TaxID=171875 RepID=UPI0035D6BF6D
MLFSNYTQAESVQVQEKGLKAWNKWKPEQGGFRATSFLFVMIGLENMGFIANMASMFLYFMGVMYFDLSGAATTLTNFLGSAFLLSTIGGFISDTYMTRLNTALIFGVVEILGLMMLTIQARYKSLQPSPCVAPPCIKGRDALFLYSTLGLIAIGSGGARGSLPAMGADQFDPNDRKRISTYFNYLLLSVTLGATVGVTAIVKISRDSGWDMGFFISTVCLFVGLAVLALGKPFYRVRVPGNSPIIRVLRVFVAAFRNRTMPLPENFDELYETNDKGEGSDHTQKIPHTAQFRRLDKAAVLREGMEPEPWKVCTATQVEEVKVLIRMMPILLSTIIMNTCLAQLNTFSVEQGNLMDLKLGKLVVPPASIPFIPLVFMSILIPLYEYFFVPFARKFTNHPSGITPLRRVGVGLVLSAISMGVAGVVEVKRRNAMNNEFKQISLFWLSYQFGIFGIADMFTLVGLLDFFYTEAPAGMRSLSTSFTFLSLSFGYYLSSVFVNVINSVTERITPSKQGWLQGLNLNKNNLNLFYWFLAILSCINFFNYLYWASWYKYKNAETTEDYEYCEKDVHGSVASEETNKEAETKNASPGGDKETSQNQEVEASQ